MLSREELKIKMTDYILKYREEYTKASETAGIGLEMDLVSYINYYYADAYFEPRRGENAFFQMFSAIDALSDKDPYLQTMQEIENEFGLDKDIIEVGCGMFPALSKLIAQRQKEIGKGTITAYDPELIAKTLDGVVLVKKTFTLSTEIPQNALIIGRKPCKVTETMIKSAAQNKSELFIKLCDCDHVPNLLGKNYTNTFKKNWFRYVDELATSTLQPGFKIEKSESIDRLVGGIDHIIKIKKLKR